MEKFFDILKRRNYNTHTMDNTFQQKNKGELDKVVTLGVLLEFTDEFLIPKINDIVKDTVTEVVEKVVDEKINTAIGKLNHDLKAYIDEKQANLVSEMFTRLDKKYAKEKQFKDKLLEILKKHNIGSAEDMAYLEGLAT